MSLHPLPFLLRFLRQLINFKKPSPAEDRELTDDDVIIRYEKGKVFGMTILHASKRKVAMSGGKLGGLMLI
ncbi:MAG: DUF2283 domain-containing protein [Thermodesulfobacteriota bacterium]